MWPTSWLRTLPRLMEKGELKRIIRNYEMDSDGEVSDEEKENMSVF